MASTNEVHLEAFREHPEYNSFRARLLPLRAGYLLDYLREREIYDTQIVPQLRQHVAPHATRVAALWAVLTRLLPSKVDHYDDPALGKIAADLTPMEKARLYAEGLDPARLGTEQSKVLRAGIARGRARVRSAADVRGPDRRLAARDPHGAARRHAAPAARLPLAARGASTTSSGSASTATTSSCSTSPRAATTRHREFLKQVRERWLDLLDGEVRNSTGLVEESRHEQLFDRYITHVSLWLKGERIRDPHHRRVLGPRSEPAQAHRERPRGQERRGVPAQPDQHDRRARDRSSRTARSSTRGSSRATSSS